MRYEHYAPLSQIKSNRRKVQRCWPMGPVAWMDGVFLVLLLLCQALDNTVWQRKIVCFAQHSKQL